jgi:uncharacterized protein (DUF1778 family)
MANRTRSIILKVTPKEDVLIRALAAANGDSVSAFMRHQALKPASKSQNQKLVAHRLEAFFRTQD